MLQYVIFSLQHRDIEFTHIVFCLFFAFFVVFTFPSVTVTIKGTIALLCLDLYNKYTVHRWRKLERMWGCVCPVGVVKWQRVFMFFILFFFTLEKSAPKLYVGRPNSTITVPPSPLDSVLFPLTR